MSIDGWSEKKMTIAHLTYCKTIEIVTIGWVGERVWLENSPEKKTQYRWIIRSNLYKDFKFISFYLNNFSLSHIDFLSSCKTKKKKTFVRRPKSFFLSKILHFLKIADSFLLLAFFFVFCCCVHFKFDFNCSLFFFQLLKSQ